MSSETNKNIFKEFGPIFIDKGYSVIPDKHGSKMPAIKAWSEYCYKMPTEAEVASWSRNFSESNISLVCGEASGVIAIDVDTEDEELLALISEHLFPSPYEKIGNKGFTRFYRYTGTESTTIFKHNGSVLFELLSNGKKTTLPPSLHPNGVTYRWLDKSLLEVGPEELPVLPPFNIQRIYDLIRSKYPDTESSKYGNFTSCGRNDDLTKLCCKLISEKKDVNSAISELVEFDNKNNKPPYFTDPEDHLHLDSFTNALKMYAYQLNRLNAKHHKKREEYETPQILGAVSNELKGELQAKKLQREGHAGKSRRVLPIAQGVIKSIQTNILDNSWIKQPDLALSASLSLMAVICSRKFVFAGQSPNLYLLNISPSGSGKDMPQQQVKRYLTDIGKDYLLGAGDYVSDASLMDSLSVKPVRLDIMDEMGGILRSINKGSSDYGGKMADILCELYTSSNTKFLGRATAEGVKGSCYRPNVSILGSTTPTGFSEGVTRSAIEKGLLGRFLVFFGDGKAAAKRLKEFPRLDKEVGEQLRKIIEYQPEVNYDVAIGGIEQNVKNVMASQEAEQKLDLIFEEFDLMRREADKDNPMLPIICRLYQQCSKVTTLHAISRGGIDGEIECVDIDFGYNLVLYYFQNMSDAVDKLVYNTQNEKFYADVSKHIPIWAEDSEGITKQKLAIRTRALGKRRRDEILLELTECGEIISDMVQIKGRQNLVYWRVK
jgi:hypothetical protein